jgi:ribonuclease HI
MMAGLDPSFQSGFVVTTLFSSTTSRNYRAITLGLEVARKMKITKLVVFGDSELVVKKVKGSYQTRNQRMRAYRNHVWDMIDNFYVAFNILLF